MVSGLFRLGFAGQIGNEPRTKAVKLCVKSTLSEVTPYDRKLLILKLERVMGIEPTYAAWEADYDPIQSTA